MEVSRPGSVIVRRPFVRRVMRNSFPGKDAGVKASRAVDFEFLPVIIDDRTYVVTENRRTRTRAFGISCRACETRGLSRKTACFARPTDRAHHFGSRFFFNSSGVT